MKMSCKHFITVIDQDDRSCEHIEDLNQFIGVPFIKVMSWQSDAESK